MILWMLVCRMSCVDDFVRNKQSLTCPARCARGCFAKGLKRQIEVREHGLSQVRNKQSLTEGLKQANPLIFVQDVRVRNKQSLSCPARCARGCFAKGLKRLAHCQHRFDCHVRNKQSLIEGLWKAEG